MSSLVDNSTPLKDLTKEYALSKTKLGSGGFGVVARCTHRASKHKFAMKIFTDSSLYTAKQVREEGRLVQSLQHDHIIRVIDFGLFKKRLCVVMDLIPGGWTLDSLFDLT